MSKARNIAALSTVEVGATADQTKADLNAIGVSGGRKNLIINGGFDVSQRGTYTTATSAPDGYYLDRWAIDVNAITANIQQLTTTVDGGTVKTMKIIATSSATGALQMYQVVEAFAVMAGRTLTFSARVKSNQSSTRLQIYDGVSFIDDAGSRHTGGGDWENLSLTFTPSSSSTTLNARITGYDGLIALTTGDYIEVANAQLELGSVATDFEHRSHVEELTLCQRYFYNVFYNNTDRATYPISFEQASGNSGWITFSVPFAVPMRVAASFTHSLANSKILAAAAPSTGQDKFSFYIQNQGYRNMAGNGNMSNLSSVGCRFEGVVGTYYCSPDAHASHIFIGSGCTFQFDAEL